MRSPAFLREQWGLQKHAVTRPLPRMLACLLFTVIADVNISLGQSRSAGKKAVEEALRLRKARDTLRDSIKYLQRVLTSRDSEPYEIAEADLELPELRDRLASVQKSLSAKERGLGVEGKKRYNHLASSQFITDLMNARALKLRLRQKLQSLKFERDRSERMFRRQLNS
jgi:hypothetical protein